MQDTRGRREHPTINRPTLSRVAWRRMVAGQFTWRLGGAWPQGHPLRHFLGLWSRSPRDVVRGPAASPATRGTSSPARIVLARRLERLPRSRHLAGKEEPARRLRPVWILPVRLPRTGLPRQRGVCRRGAHSRHPASPAQLLILKLTHHPAGRDSEAVAKRHGFGRLQLLQTAENSSLAGG